MPSALPPRPRQRRSHRARKHAARCYNEVPAYRRVRGFVASLGDVMATSFTGRRDLHSRMTRGDAMPDFQVVAPFTPTGDQPTAIGELTQSLPAGNKYQSLLGVTGSGKTFTVGNVAQEVQQPTLVLAPNKTQTAHLRSE